MEIVTKIAPIALALIMLTLGLGLTIKDFTRVISQPKDFLLGVICQLIILPIAAFILIKMLPMLSVIDAVKENLINPILIGDKDEIQKCAEELQFDISKYEIIHEPKENATAKIAAKLASQGKIKIIVKGHIHTDVLIPDDFLDTLLSKANGPNTSALRFSFLASFVISFASIEL